MYKGTQLSVNTYFAQLERKTGLCEPYALAKAMGVDLTDPDHERVPTFTLGVADVSPLEMAAAYATVAARGKHCDNRPVTQILNSDGKVFKNYPKECQQVIQESAADTINAILKGIMQPGGFGQALALDKPSAGKTGTIDSNKAVWFDGYTPALATASMVAGANSSGHADHAERQDRRRTQHRRGVRLDRGRSRCGRRPCEPSRTSCPTRTSPHRPGSTTTADPGRDPRRHRHVDAPGGEKLAGAGFYVTSATAPLQRARGQRRRDRARPAGDSAPRGSTVTLLPVVAAEPEPSGPAELASYGGSDAPPSARPLVFGVSTPITRPIARMPSSRTPSSSIVAATSASISSALSCSGR